MAWMKLVHLRTEAEAEDKSLDKSKELDLHYATRMKPALICVLILLGKGYIWYLRF